MMSDSSLDEVRFIGGKPCYLCGRLHKNRGYLCEECTKFHPFPSTTVIEVKEESAKNE